MPLLSVMFVLIGYSNSTLLHVTWLSATSRTGVSTWVIARFIASHAS